MFVILRFNLVKKTASTEKGRDKYAVSFIVHVALSCMETKINI